MTWLITFLITLIVSAIYELLALNTPINIFGSKYRYNLGLSMFRWHFRRLPIVIPFFWATTKVLIPSFLGFIWIDLLYDPLAIRQRLWKFERKGLWFGVPLTNYLGWAIVWLSVEVIKYGLT